MTQPQQTEPVYTFTCSHIDQNNTVPEITDIMTGCALSRSQVDHAIDDLKAVGYLIDASLLPTAHFPDVPF